MGIETKVKNRTRDEVMSEKDRAQSAPKTQRRESDEEVESEVYSGTIQNKQADAKDWKPR